MKKMKLAIVPILLICVMMFGAWAPINSEVRYADAPFLSTYASETISFTKREFVERQTTDGGCPQFWQISGLTNACGAVAGAEIVAFYDKYYPELIPNWTSYYTASGKYRSQDSTHVPALMNSLYTLMRTNVDDVGVSKTDFLNGLKSYVNGQGYSISYQDVKSGQSVNYAQCKNAIDNNKVVALLVYPTSIYDMSNGTSSDTIMSISISGAHIMVAYGYCQIKYYNASGAFRTDTYLMVATGQPGGLPTALYKVGPSDINGAYVINIG